MTTATSGDTGSHSAIFSARVVLMLKLRKPFAFILLVIFLANAGLWSLARKNLSHELMHASIVQLAADHDHRASAPTQSNDDDAMSTVQHRVLHAADHVQFLTGLPGHTVPVAIAASPIPQQFPPQALPRPALDQPFRPPRRLTLTA